MANKNDEYFIGVDVGTGSARAALISKHGKVMKVATQDIQTWTPKNGYFEQSSDNIWEVCCLIIQNVLENVSPTSVKGIGFDATCSLVTIDEKGSPVTVSPTGISTQNIILWLDHRATEEANLINRLKHPVLRSVGGNISLEMETPKLLWLRKNMPESWAKTASFFDLPDFLTWKATGCDTRSLCSLVCKWTYESSPCGNNGWNESYFDEIGLSDLKENNWRRIGSAAQPPGQAIGRGLSDQAATEMGLLPGTPVATSIIDAHAGGLGMLGCSTDGIPADFSTRLGLISGTSTCHMAVSSVPLFVPGVWGPYFSAMVPGMWLNEGGQSATGKLLEHVIDIHPASAQIKEAIPKHKHIHEYLNDLLASMARKQGLVSIAHLTRDVHVWPDFHGNRSPLGDPTLRGMISGLSLSSDEEHLAVLYLATVQALAYGTRHIIESLRVDGVSELRSVLICGGLSRNPIFVQTQADVLGLPVLRPRETESVLLGAAMLGACAAGTFPSVQAAVQAMGGPADVVTPVHTETSFHNKKYKVFRKMVQDQVEYKNIMEDQ